MVRGEIHKRSIVSLIDTMWNVSFMKGTNNKKRRDYHETKSICGTDGLWAHRCPVRVCTDKDLVGVRYHGKKHVDLFKLEGVSLSEAVTQAVRDYFTDNGIKVTDCKGWDGSPEGLDRLPRDLDRVIGGTIDSFMIEAKSGVSITTISYTIKMRVLIGKIDERKVVIRTVESTPRDKTVGFDPEKIKGKLNSIVTEALQKLLAEGLL
jgi:hypothetical protein